MHTRAYFWRVRLRCCLSGFRCTQCRHKNGFVPSSSSSSAWTSAIPSTQRYRDSVLSNPGQASHGKVSPSESQRPTCLRKTRSYRGRWERRFIDRERDLHVSTVLGYGIETSLICAQTMTMMKSVLLASSLHAQTFPEISIRLFLASLPSPAHRNPLAISTLIASFRSTQHTAKSIILGLIERYRWSLAPSITYEAERSL